MKELIEIIKTEDVLKIKELFESMIREQLNNKLSLLEEIVLHDSLLDEAAPKIKIRVNSRGQRKKIKKCPPGYRLIDGSCKPLTSSEKLAKKKSIRKSLRTKRADASGKRKANMRRILAMKKRKKQGL